MKGVSPTDGRKTGLKDERAHNIIDGEKNALSSTILLGCVWAQHAQANTVGKKECVSQGLIEFMAVIALDCLDRGAKMHAHIQ